MAEHLMVLTTVDAQERAYELARALVGERLAACVTILPGARSIYRYEGVVEDSGECVVLMKTRSERYAALAERLEALHPYDVPEIVAFPIEAGSPAYLHWIDENVL